MLKKSLKYIIPSILTAIFGSIYIIIDGFYVGKKIGDDGLAALNIAWPVTGFLQSIGIGIGLAGGILLAVALSNKDKEKEEKILKTTYFSLIAVSLFLMVLIPLLNPLLRVLGTTDKTHQYAYDYLLVILCGTLFQVCGQALIPILRNYGKIKTITIIMTSAGFMNIFGDYLLVDLLDLKLIGAALASILGQATYAIGGMIILLKIKKLIIGIPNYPTFKKLARSTLAPFILNMSGNIILIIYNLRCMKYGNEPAVASYTVFAYLFCILGVCASGVGDGIQPLISQSNALNQTKDERKLLKIGFVFTNLICIILTLLILIFKTEIANGFNLSNEGLEIYEDGLIFFIIGYLFIATQRMSMSYLYATQRVKLANILVILEPFITTPILLFTLPNFMNLNGIWLSYMISQIVVFTVAILFIILSKKGTEKHV